LKIKDTIANAVLAGSIATIAQETFSWLMFWIGIANATPAHYAAKLLLGKPNVPMNKIWIGFAGHLIAGLVFGLAFVYLMRKLGKDYYLLKGITFGALAWLTTYALIPNLTRENLGLNSDTMTVFIDLITYVIWGIIASIVINKYSDLSQKIS
jgi:uncharacterized membrane protein YagU involved in acid resistance